MKKFAAAAVLLTALAVAMGQDKTASKKEDTKKPDEPAPVVVKGQLPRYFKQLGLTDVQKKEVYKVRAAYAAKIAKLNEEIAALRLKERDDTEAVLTAAQKDRLKELRGK